MAKQKSANKNFSQIEKIPAVSVLISMYNSEKFIGETLESILHQTLKNFEVIVVDDCSTDNSREIVKSYFEKFGGRLKLMKLPKNHGKPCVPRNRGLEMSRGKYIYFMDSDDILMKTALEEMYNLAEKFQSDVIYCEKYYTSRGSGENFWKNIHVADLEIQRGGFVDKPTALSDDLLVRLQEWADTRFWMPPWLYFVSRDFLVLNDIKFQPIFQEDNDWSFRLICLAKKFIRVPNICLVYRRHDESFTGKAKTLNEYSRRWFEKSISGLKLIDEFMGGIEFFQKRPEIRFAILDKWVTRDLNILFKFYQKVPPYFAYSVFKDEFKSEFGKNDILISYLISREIFSMQQQLSQPPPCWINTSVKNKIKICMIHGRRKEFENIFFCR